MSTDASATGNTFDWWTKYERYRWMSHLPRMAWGWELLRRNPFYRSTYRTVAASAVPGKQTSLSPADREFAHWSLVRFEDPDIDVRSANVLWRTECCRYVLPLIATSEHGQDDGGYFRLDGLQCRVNVYRDEAAGRCHILFAQDGRFLQLEISGAVHLENRTLTMPILPHPTLRSARSLALRQLTDLMATGTMRPSLYRPYSYNRVARLIEVVRALDGHLAGATYRDIALAFYGPARVRRDWHYPNNYLREHVCRTVESGLRLMNGGYRHFLT